MFIIPLIYIHFYIHLFIDYYSTIGTRVVAPQYYLPLFASLQILIKAMKQATKKSITSRPLIQKPPGQADEPKLQSKIKIEAMASIPGAVESKRDWLSPFLEQVSQPQSQQPDLRKDEQKFITHCTQFADPLKYCHYNRYLEEELADVRQQMQEFSCLNAIPPMPTTPESAGGQGRQRYREKIGESRRWYEEKMNEVRLKYEIFQWKPKETSYQGIDQILIRDSHGIGKGEVKRQNIEEPAVINVDQHNGQQPLLDLNKLGQILNNAITGPTGSQQQVFQQLSNFNFTIHQLTPVRKENQLPTNSPQTKCESECCILYHSQMAKAYRRYGDALAVIGAQADGLGLLVLLVEDWRLRLQPVAILLTNHISGQDSGVESALVVYFNAMGLPPLSVTIVPGTNPMKMLKQSIANATRCSHITDNEQQSTPSTNKNDIEQIYSKFECKIGQLLQKYSQSTELKAVSLQMATKIATKQDKTTWYTGFYGSRQQQLLSLAQIIKGKVKTGNIGSTFVGVLEGLAEHSKKRIAQEMQKATMEAQCDISPIVSLSTMLSPAIYCVLLEAWHKSGCITHLKYLSATAMEVYSVDSQPHRCLTHKHTVVYHTAYGCWYCNCQWGIQRGLPCCHLMKVVTKMGGDLMYYISSRWMPNRGQLKTLHYHYSTWNTQSEDIN